MKQPECDSCQEQCEHPQAICLAKEMVLPDQEAQELAELFKMLGDPTRVKILQVLSAQELCVCDLAAVVEMGQSAVSHQLRLLRNARLVKYRREGKNAWYSLNDDHVIALFQQGLAHIRHS